MKESKFLAMADNWLARTQKLADYYMETKSERALNLLLIMQQRMVRITLAYTRHKQPKKPMPSFINGGIVSLYKPKEFESEHMYQERVILHKPKIADIANKWTDNERSKDN